MREEAEQAERVHEKWPTAVTPVATDTTISYVIYLAAYREYPQPSGILTLLQIKGKTCIQPHKALTSYSGACQ